MNKPEELAKLLGHADRRVRQRAQFALAHSQQVETFAAVLKEKTGLLARLHALWGLGQIARLDVSKTPKVKRVIDESCDVDDPAELRAQTMKVLGDMVVPVAPDDSIGAFDRALTFKDALWKLQFSNDSRTRFFAAMLVGKSAGASKKEGAEQLFALLKDNADADPYLRHAAVMGLYYLGDADALVAKANDKNRSVRLGVLLALRRLGDARVVNFLNDEDPSLATEAARAIHDLPIEKALPGLAAVLELKDLPRDEALIRRAISAAYRIGGESHAKHIAALAARDDVSNAMRIEAMDTLVDWEGRVPRDRVLGSHLVVPKRTIDEAKPAAKAIALDIVLGKAAPDVRAKAAALIESFNLPVLGERLMQLVRAEPTPVIVRKAVLDAMGGTGNDKLGDAITFALASSDAGLRNDARRWLAKLKPADAVPVLEGVLETGGAGEQQAAFATLSDMKNNAADAVLEKWLDKLIAGKVTLEIQLDLIDAARRRDIPRMKLKLAAWEAALSKDDPLKGVRQMLAGGDVEAGKKVFWEATKAQCSRCHKVHGQGAGEAGPDLFETLKKQEYAREYILESILFPNRKITEGFDTVLIETIDGDKITGVIRGDDGKTITLYTPDNKKMTFKAGDILDKRKVKSAMPEDFAKHLSEREIRDLVEYLAGQK